MLGDIVFSFLNHHLLLLLTPPRVTLLLVLLLVPIFLFSSTLVGLEICFFVFPEIA
jgi:hypothetical protein